MLAAVVAVHLAAAPLTLDEVRAASRQNLQALQAELDLARGKAGTKLAWSAIFPTVDLSLRVSDTAVGSQKGYAVVPDPNNPGQYVQTVVGTPGFNQANYGLGLSVNQLLYDGGRWWSQIAQSGAQEAASRGQLDEQRLAAELEATRRFYELVRAQLTLQVLQASVDRSRDQVQRARSLFDAGRAQRSAVLDAETNLGNDEISVLRQQQAITGAQLDLLQWIGRPSSEVEAVVPEAMNLSRTPADAPGPDALIDAARSQRPLVRALEANLKAGKLGVDVARADYWPRLSANLSYNRGSPSAEFFFDPRVQNSLSVGGTFTWRLFNGFGTDSNVETAQASATQAELQQRQSLVDLEAEIRRGHKTLSTQLAIATLATKNKQLADAQLKLEEERYAAGAGSTIEVRNAQLKLTQAQLTQLQGRIDVEIARAALRRSIGGELAAAAQAPEASP